MKMNLLNFELEEMLVENKTINTQSLNRERRTISAI